MNQGRSTVVTRCSTSRNITVTDAKTIANAVTSATSGTSSGSAAQKVVRVPGTMTRFSGSTIANMTSIVTRLLATTDTGRSWRGNRTCLTRAAWPSRLVHDIWSADWKKIHVISPDRTKSG